MDGSSRTFDKTSEKSGMQLSLECERGKIVAITIKKIKVQGKVRYAVIKREGKNVTFGGAYKSKADAEKKKKKGFRSKKRK